MKYTKKDSILEHRTLRLIAFEVSQDYREHLILGSQRACNRKAISYTAKGENYV